jgi:hypothetical protein
MRRRDTMMPLLKNAIRGKAILDVVIIVNLAGEELFQE